MLRTKNPNKVIRKLHKEMEDLQGKAKNWRSEGMQVPELKAMAKKTMQIYEATPDQR